MRSNRTGPLMCMVICAMALLVAALAPSQANAVTYEQAKEALEVIDQEVRPQSCELAVEREAVIGREAQTLEALRAIDQSGEFAAVPEALLIERVAYLLRPAVPIDDDTGDINPPPVVAHVQRNIDVKLMLNTAQPTPTVLLRI